MRNNAIITLLFLIPVLLLLNENIQWESFALKSIALTGDFSSARGKLASINRNSEVDYENYRLKQLLLIALCDIPLLAVLTALQFSTASTFLVLLLIAGGVIGVTEKKLNDQVKSHRERIESDFPAIVEMMTLALSAGETPLSAIQRISQRGSSPLAQEFASIVEEVRRGEAFAHALDSMGRRTQSIIVRRFIDAVVVAVTRGAPLIDVLHSHAREARDFQRNRTLSAAGKAEISMMIPVVFLILPISILFALWPSLTGLNLFVAS